MRSLTIDAAVESWPIAGAFVIARGAKREATVVVAQVSDGTITGRGECVPYARYGETVGGVRDAILGLRGTLRDRAGLALQIPAGAARNALDCALWDYEAKRAGTSAARLAGLDALVGRYHAVNIKLDKAGGLTEALALAAEARRRGFRIVVGCMVSTSLAMAPALLLAQGADWVDLDGPLLLARDRAPCMRYEGALVHPPDPQLWG